MWPKPARAELVETCDIWDGRLEVPHTAGWESWPMDADTGPAVPFNLVN
jgi:hypothetical protein